MGSMLKALCLGVLFVAAWSLVGAEPRGSITGVVYERQGSLLGMVQGESDSLHDEVFFTLGKKGVNNSSPDVKPETWTCEPKGGAWRCWGPSLSTSFFSFAPSGNYRFPNRLELGVSYQGRSLFESKLDVQSIGLPKIENSLDGILDTPARISPGGYFTARPIKAGYEHGTWRARIDGRTLETIRLSDSQLGALPPSGRDFSDYVFLTPGVVAPDSKVSFTYDGPWGERLVDAPAPGIFIGDPFSDDCQPKITACPSMASTGGSICVCGCFPGLTSGASLLLDGRPVAINASSPYVTTVSLADVEPGRHEITWAPGSGGGGSVEFEAVRVGGKIDKEVIMKGGSADLEFWVDGGLTLPIWFESGNVFGLAPRPPIDPDNLEVRVQQLGLRAAAGTFGEFTFETRADQPSIGRFTNVEVSDEGHFRSGDVDFNLYTEFAVPYSGLLPLKVGLSYEFGLSDWSFEGTSEDLGKVDFRQRAGTTSSVVFDRIETDKARTLVHGYADFTLRGTMRIDF